MSRMSDYSIWIEDVLNRDHWNTDNSDVQDCLYRNQNTLMAMYVRGYNDESVADTFKSLFQARPSVTYLY